MPQHCANSAFQRPFFIGGLQVQLLDTSGLMAKGWHTSENNGLNIVVDIIGSVRLEVLVGGTRAGLLVKPFLQIRFFVSDQLANFDELGAYLTVSPLLQSSGLSVVTEKEFCSLLGIYSGHGFGPISDHCPTNENGQSSELSTTISGA